MPNNVYAAQIDKVFVIKVDGGERAPFIALAVYPVNFHVFPISVSKSRVFGEK